MSHSSTESGRPTRTLPTLTPGPYRKHLGMYGYRKAALARFATLPPSWLETVERLEQLRLLDNGMDIYVAPAPSDTVGVDTEEDLRAAEAILIARARN